MTTAPTEPMPPVSGKGRAEAAEAERDAALAKHWEHEEGVDEIVSGYRTFINEHPELMSLLYDIDMLPEQTVSRAGAVRLAGLCEVWKRLEAVEAERDTHRDLDIINNEERDEVEGELRQRAEAAEARARKTEEDAANLRAKYYAAENELRVAVERLFAAPLPSDYESEETFMPAYGDWLAKRRLVALPASAEREYTHPMDEPLTDEESALLNKP